MEPSHVSATGMEQEDRKGRAMTSGLSCFFILMFQMRQTAELVFHKKNNAIVLKWMKNPDKDDVLF